MQDDIRHLRGGGQAGVQVLSGVWRFRWLVAAGTLLAALIGFGASQLQPVRYEATADMLLSNPRDVGVFREVGPRNVDATRYLRNQAERLQSSTVAARTAEQFDGDLTAAEVRERIVATASGDADVLSVTASGETAEEAAALANTVVAAYQEVVAADMRALMERSMAELEEAQVEIQARIDAAQAVLDDTPANEFAERERDAAVNQLIGNQQLIERIAVDAALYGSGVEMVEPAVPPESPVEPRTTQNTLLAALLGLGGAAALAVWRSRVLRRADHRHDAVEILQVPLLGAVPDSGSLSRLAEHCPTVVEPDSPVAEAYRFVAAALEHTLNEDVRTIVVTSALPGEGKTTVALNLAVALKQTARTSMLVDTDVRQRGLSKLTLANGRPGLADLGEYSVGDALYRWGQEWEPAVQALPPVVPVGIRNVDPTQFFRTNRYRTALQRLNEHAHLLILDAPPLLSVSDASAIAGSADAIVLVVNRGTPLHVLTALQERLAFVGTPVFGYVFNRTDRKRGPYYGYGYGYGYGGDSSPTAATADVWGVQFGDARPSNDVPESLRGDTWPVPTRDGRDPSTVSERR